MTTENTEFDLEFAKRGGVIHLTHQKYSGAWAFYPLRFALAKLSCPYGINEFFIITDEDRKLSDCGSIVSDVNVIDYRMATRAECEAAGIEYIERPKNYDQVLADFQELNMRSYTDDDVRKLQDWAFWAYDMMKGVK